MLDDIDKTQIGRYGTISLLKRQNPPTVVTSFGIDTEELTFGRDRDCSIRLYYPDIDFIHCKLIFEDRKAFLIVLGKNGLSVDGCLVYPNPTLHGTPTTIPLTNNSEIEIHNKRFRFTYPPKELRALLFASPIRSSRAPRLSMIRSAQVFSPKLSKKNLKENVRLLQSPLKATFLRSPLNRSNHVCGSNQDRNPSKPTFEHVSRYDCNSTDEEGCEEIVLVEGDTPCFVEEEKDLVILEDVEVPLPSTSSEYELLSGPDNDHRLHPSIVNPPQTPRWHSNSHDSLHRAVLIRSAQRTVIRAEKEEDELEEMEVLSVVASDDDNVVEHAPETEINRSTDVWSEARINGQALKPSQDLSTVIDSDEQDPLSSLNSCGDLRQKQDDIKNLQTEGTHSLTGANLATCYESFDTHNHLGDFRTPQPQSRRQFRKLLDQNRFSFKTATSRDGPRMLDDLTDSSPGKGRYSITSAEPRRVLVEMPWRVEDLVVPTKSEEHSLVDSSDIAHKARTTESNSRSSAPHSVTPSSARRGVDERERKAIRERRRSALREMDSFFAGSIPGMGSTPTKKTALSYYQDQSLHGTPKGSVVSSLEENIATLASGNSPDKTVKSEEDEELDTRILLERMKVTVEGMKRRRSTIFTPPSTLMQHNGPPLSDNLGPATETNSPDRIHKEDPTEQYLSNRAEELGGQQRFSLDLPNVVLDPLQDGNEDNLMEKSFSQLMRSESPEDLEQPTEDIRHILEQDITIPSENLRYTACDITTSNPYASHCSTRNQNASTEPEPNLLVGKHDTAHDATLMKQVVNGRTTTDTEKSPTRNCPRPPSHSRDRNHRRPEQKTISEEQEMPSAEVNTSEEDEENRGSTPTPAPRMIRPSRRGGVGSVVNSRQRQDKSEDLKQVSSSVSNRRLKISTTMNPISESKKNPGKVKKAADQGTEGTRKIRTRSTTVNDDASRMNASKTPATRRGGRKGPATAPSAIAVDGEGERPSSDKESSRNSRGDGTRVRISRTKARLNSAAGSRVKDEEISTHRVTRTRARART